MTELDVECMLQRAREKYPEAHPRIISDNGPQFIAGEFKNFIRLCGMTQVRTSHHYPQSNGKLERWHRSVESEAIRPASPTTVEEAVRILDTYPSTRRCTNRTLADFLGCASERWSVKARASSRAGDRRP